MQTLKSVNKIEDYEKSMFDASGAKTSVNQMEKHMTILTGVLALIIYLRDRRIDRNYILSTS